MSPFRGSRDSLGVSSANGDPTSTGLTEDEQFDRALDRYLAGECSAAESAAFERTVLGGASGAGDALNAMVAGLGGADRASRDARASWRAFHDRVVAPTRRPTPVRPRRWVPAWAQTGAIAAATLLVGIVVGRVSSSSGRSTAVAPGRQLAATSPATGGSGIANPMPAIAPTPTPAPAGAPLITSPATRVASAVRRPPATASRPARGSASAADATDRVVAQHLRHTDVFLTAFRTDARAGRVAPEVITWAHQLLVTTEMLRDSKAVHDPRMRSLLQDLELVLVQIAHYQPQRGARDVELVQDAMDDSGLLTRVRGAIPDRSTGAGS